jgi:hypothetical protein
MVAERIKFLNYFVKIFLYFQINTANASISNEKTCAKINVAG